MDYELIKLVMPKQAKGEVKEIYDEIIKVEGEKWLAPLWGWFANRPKLLRHVWKTLRTLEIDDGPVPRQLMISISLVVAAEVGCVRCANFHEETMRQRLGVSEEYFEKLRNFEKSDLPEKEKVVFRFAKKIGFGIQLEPSEFKALRDHGYTDEQLVEIAYIAIFEAGLARHAVVLAPYEEGFNWPAENTPSVKYKENIAT